MFTQAVLGMVLPSHVSAAWTVLLLALLSGSAARSLDQRLAPRGCLSQGESAYDAKL
jgi:hypothetical protein